MDLEATDSRSREENSAPKRGFTVSVDEDREMELLEKLFTSDDCFDIPTPAQLRAMKDRGELPSSRNKFSIVVIFLLSATIV
jgi:hypothetical protein